MEGWVTQFGPRLLAYARQLTAPQDAEDIVAETFCRAAQNLAAMRSSGRPDLYLLTTARNLCRDRFRRRPAQTVSAERIDQSPHPGAGPAVCAARQEHQRALRDAVAALPEPLREVVVLRTTVGLKFEEIAGLLHVPLGTALSRMHTAIGRLRQKLDYVRES